jgi:hypothetical protein
MKFCAHYLIDHGIDTPNQFLLLVDSLRDTDPKYNFIKIIDRDEMFISMATQLKQLWPKGTREINGKRYPWQDSVQNIVTRLKLMWNSREFADKYTIDDVLQCARQYLSDFENDATYMLSLPYFIWKGKTIGPKGSGKQIQASKLADMLEGSLTASQDSEWETAFSDYNSSGDII